jgi:hypothetical protein
VGRLSSHATASDNAYRWLLSQQVNAGLVDSYEDDNDIGYVYDQAIAVIAFIAKDDLVRARQVLDTLKALQHADGYWHTAYYCSSHRVQEHDRHVGPVLWVALTVVHYERASGDDKTYRAMAIKAIDWCMTLQQADGGINGGYDRNGDCLSWCSTEHNEDAYAALRCFGRNDQAAVVKHYLDTHVWDNDAQRFLCGRNDRADPMDVNSWGVAALGASGTHDYAASLDYVLRHHRCTQSGNAGGKLIAVDGFDFDSNQNDIWFEGQGEMAVAFKTVGRVAEADYFIDEIIKMQDADGGTGVRYSLNGTHNGYWQMKSDKSVSGSAWLIFAIHGVNPFLP